MPDKHRRLWDAVRGIILKHYNLLKDEFIRDAYYINRDLLAPLIGSEVTQGDYDWLVTPQGYESLRDDIWPKLEQKHGLERPKTWPVGVIYWNETAKPLSEVGERDLGSTWSQARGFIFVEKGGEADKIKILSKYGWLICAGKGYPERLMRKLLKADSRPVLALHDWDRDGGGIYKALGFETRRTKHLDIALGERVIDLGLMEEDVKRLKLPTEPSPPKYKGKPRVELSGLAVLKSRWKIKSPTLAYVVAKMASKGFTLSETEVDKREMLQRHMRWVLTDGLRGIVDEAVDDVMAGLQNEKSLEGTAVEGSLKNVEVVAPGLKEKLVETGENLADEMVWHYEGEYHKKALQLTDEKLVRALARP